MRLTITTWNINSVRLRIDGVARFVKAVRPDVLCLQETKCPDDRFPLRRFKRLGYEHVALNGQKGYHGVAVLSRVPFDHVDVRSFCGKTDCRHVGVTLGERAGLRDPLTLHNFYVPTGGNWIDATRHFVPAPAKLFTWWSYRSPDWAVVDKGRRLDHVWVAPALGDRIAGVRVMKEARGWARPSDHVPVTATLEI